MAESTSVTMTLGYSGTEFTRKMKVANVQLSALNNVAAKAKAVNASLAGGTDGGLADFFRSDDYDASDSENIVGKFSGIVSVQSETVEETEINLNE